MGGGYCRGQGYEVGTAEVEGMMRVLPRSRVGTAEVEGTLQKTCLIERKLRVCTPSDNGAVYILFIVVMDHLVYFCPNVKF